VHILILASWYPSDLFPHAGIFIRQQAKALKKNGHKIGVVSVIRASREVIKREKSKSGKLKPEVTDIYTVQTFVKNYLPFIPYSSGLAWILAGRSLFRQYVDQNGMPDILHAHSALYGGALGVYLKHKYEIPLLITEHSTALITGKIPIWQIYLVKYVFSRSDQGIAVSQGQADTLAIKYDSPKNGWSVVHNLVEELYEEKKLVKRADDYFRFLSIGYLIPRKDFPSLLKAFSLLQQQAKYEHTLLRIIGEGDEKKNLLNLAKVLNIETMIEWIPERLPEDIIDDYDESHAIVSSSLMETFGVTLIEGLARGIPAIATRSGGPQEFIIPKVGKLIDKEQPDKLAEAMAQVIDAYKTYSPEAIRKYCLDNFGPNAISIQLNEIYSEYANFDEN